MRKATKEILLIIALLIQSSSIGVESLQGRLLRNEIPVKIKKLQKRQHRNHLQYVGWSPHAESSLFVDATSKQQEAENRDLQSYQRNTEEHVPLFQAIGTVAESTSTIQQQQQPQNLAEFRKVHRIEKFARLPVWPVLNGVFIWIVGNLFGFEKAAQLENAITGRVSPNFYQYTDTSPFIMLVHHCHTFSTFDPVRYIQRTFFPEGFPAHPHRGFITITYILHGGFIHRDSEGVYQAYGAVSDPLTTNQPDRYNGKHTQWLTTGRGMLHEEMFDITAMFDLNHLNSRQELYQIWLNVPARYKMDEPCSLLLGGNDETPVIYSDDGGSKTLVLAGTYNGQSSIAPILTELVLFHVTLQPGACWKFDAPSSLYETAFIYMRQGKLHSVSGGGSVGDDGTDNEITIPVHHTAYFERQGGNTVQVKAGSDEVADFMFLAGVPIQEPCYASGSMVMNYPNEIEDAYNDYQKGLFGIPWDHKLSNDDWKIHVHNTKRGQNR
jgi:redox-sensitive bicupin YhaK (pirin superfamily)